MSGLRSLARPMLASIFVVQGLETFQHPEKVARAAEPVVKPVAGMVPAVPDDVEQAVRLNGAVQVVAGTTMGLGVLPRLSALVLAGSLVPTTLAGHRYWEIEDPEQRAQQRVHFLKNVTMLGGLLIAAADTGGSPSLAWRRRRAAHRTSHHLAEVQQSLAESGRAASEQLAAATSATASSARAAGDQLSQLSQILADAARLAGGYLAEVSQTVAESARKAGDQLPGAAQSAAGSARAAGESAKAAADQAVHAMAGPARIAAEQVAQGAHTAVAAGRRTASQLSS
jgi:putative oxidoreductase